MKNIIKTGLILLSLCLTFCIVGCDSNKQPEKANLNTKNNQKTNSKLIIPKKSDDIAHIEKTKTTTVGNQSESVNYNVVKNKHQRDSGKLDFNLMTNEELINYASELLENGTYDENVNFINLSHDRLSSDYALKDLAIALYSNAIANATSNEEIISHNLTIGQLLYSYYTRRLIKTPLTEARPYLESTFEKISVENYNHPATLSRKSVILYSLSDIYMQQKLPLEASFKLLNNVLQTYEIKKDNISQDEKMIFDMADETFFNHVADYIRTHPDIEYSKDIVKQVKEGLLRHENTPDQRLLWAKNLQLLHEFVKDNEK